MPSATPVTVSSSATTLNPATQAALTSALLSANAIPRIQSALQQSLQESGWTHSLQSYVLKLLRDGECTTYEELMARVMAECRPGDTATDNKDKDKDSANGDGAVNGTSSKNGSGVDIKVPDRAVREGIRAVRKEIERVCDISFD
ncbi:hypothetical protein IWX90DRAFT_240131 [Phyllosticta citrichinensis]|uniref:Uncharacterized protein n=1 Tax=Phyllosticta citrichinensis TaxID=1130410 RepID=A0ABR1XQ32_9PEZI